MEIFRIFGSVFLNSDGVDSQLDAVNRRAEGTSSTFGSMIGTAGKVGLAIGGAAIAGGAALLGLATSASDTASRVADMSAKIGISKAGFQEWDYVLSQAGVDVGVLQVGFKKFGGAIDDATNGGKKQQAMLTELGISLTDAGGQVKSTEQLFNESVTAFQGMEDGAHKSALASDLFGKSATEMGAILNGNADDLAKAKQSAHEFGLVLSDEAIDAGDTFGDTMDNVKKSIGALATGIGVEVMPVIQTMMDWFISNMPMIKEVTGRAFEFIGSMIKPVAETIIPLLTKAFEYVSTNVVPILAQKFQEWFPKIQKIVQGLWDVTKIVLDALKVGFDYTFPYIKEIVNTAITVITGIIDGLLKVIQGIIDFLVGVFTGDWDKAWQGIKDVFSGVIDVIGTVIDGAIAYFGTITTYIKDTFMLAWDKAWNKVGEVVKGIWSGIVDGIKGYINLITGAINGMLSGITSSINAVISLFNKIPSVNIPTLGTPNIPKLATGTNYVPQDMLAMIHKGEAVIPAKYNNGSQQGLTLQINVNGNVVGTNGMKELADILSGEINKKFGLSIGGAV